MQLQSIGFIGLGTMGGAMCRNLVRRFAQADFTIFDLNPEAIAAVAGAHVKAASSVAGVAGAADVIFLSMPDGAAVARVCEALDGALRPGAIIIDTSTSDVAMTRALAARFAEKGIFFLDAPIARTREAAENGTLSIMVGGDRDTFARVKPLLEAMGTEITHCGPSGCGQVVKILNNMVVFQTANALSEAMAIAAAHGVGAELLFDVFSKSSADSFVLRNHGMKALMKDNFPLRAFSTNYARKDNSYALAMASAAGVAAPGAELVDDLLARTQAAGYSEEYYPVFHRLRTAGKSVV